MTFDMPLAMGSETRVRHVMGSVESSYLQRSTRSESDIESFAGSFSSGDSGEESEAEENVDDLLEDGSEEDSGSDNDDV